MMVILGYAVESGNLHLLINDPEPINQGRQKWIKYEVYDKDIADAPYHTHWNDYYDIQ